MIELRCTYDPQTRGGSAPDGRKVKATIHWVSAQHAIQAPVRLYDRLFHEENPGSDFVNSLNPDSLEVLEDCWLEPSLGSAQPGDRFQFERLGYFCVDPVDSTGEKLIFNRTVTLRDAWSRIAKRMR